MVERMIAEGLLEKLNLEAVCEKYGVECLYSYIDDKCKGLYYDPTNEYSVPYTYGRVGIIYNKEVVDKADIGGWDLMWNRSMQVRYFSSIIPAMPSRQRITSLDIASIRQIKLNGKRHMISFLLKRALFRAT